MSNIRDYFRSKALNRRELSKHEMISKVIERKYFAGELDKSLPKFDSVVLKKEEIEYVIQSVYGWEKTATGFEYRNSFCINATGQDILFDRYFITKTGDKFETDGSEVSDIFIKSHSKALNQLIKIHQAYDTLFQIFESDLNCAEEKATIEHRLESAFSNSKIEQKVHEKNRHTQLFFNVYGELGKRILIKWLNKLSDSQKSMDELLEEFISDMNVANIYFSEHLAEKYLKKYIFEYVLLNELAQYSPRGEFLKWMYKNINEKENQKVIEK